LTEAPDLYQQDLGPAVKKTQPAPTVGHERSPATGSGDVGNQCVEMESESVGDSDLGIRSNNV
jgi:hypothetical protein